MSIERLSEHVIAQIAAGEVVERPASVVKELLENALDAGAASVHITVNGGGQKFIRLSDDGSGIPADEVELALARHATSKLRTADDLSFIETLGFRGEALASIAAVSRATLVTRHREENIGTQLRVEGSNLLNRQAVGAPAGTVITIENLFFNTPARLKFMKKENTEKRFVANIVTRYAMAYPHVRFVLEQDGREVFRSSGTGNLADVVVKSLGLDSFKQMVEVNAEDEAREDRPAVAVFGYTSAPGLNRADRAHITLFVNGRWVQDSSLTYAVIQAYHTLLMNGRYPVSVLMVNIDPQEVDVNVHPTKAEVRFRDANAVFSAVQRAVRQSVVALAQTPDVSGSAYRGFAAARPSISESYARQNLGWNGGTQLDLDLPLESPGQYPQQRVNSAENPTEAEDPTAIPYGIGAPRKPRTLPMLRVVGQIGAMYIVAEGPSGMYLIDQHAAHERILYEQFMENYERREKVRQLTLEAQTIELPPLEARMVEEKLDALAMVGFEIEPFGANTFVIRSIPAMLADQNPVEAVMDILDDLALDKQPGQQTIEEKIIKQVCRRAAVKAGQILSIDEMQSIIRQLERCASPHTCPHGRPTMLHMSGDQLAREFGRA
ncbi:MAG: DNA mismatch repair endonuclease MutL [Chitinophagaceae bacterium]|nr:DNA mismatch repair endonuclease MutL [Anaerolineae bacterium]